MTALALSAPFDGFPVFTDDLVDRLAARRREVAALEAECTAMVAELIRRDAHDDLGYRSMVSLLVDRHGGRALDYWAQQAALEITEHDATLRRRQRRLWISEVDGMVHIDGRFDPIAGQVLLTALNRVTAPQNA